MVVNISQIQNALDGFISSRFGPENSVINPKQASILFEQ